MKSAVIYARVSSDKQKEEHTIASQTEALRAFARQQGFSVPDEWVIEDEGYSGATLVRPGLERVRDLAAEGQIDAVLVYSPDRLSRRYAYQVLLIEELARHNVKTLFIKSPQTTTPEDQLLLQFQGMIAEYERAQILERSRRGKRHRALQGVVNVLSGAPYGYRYIRKSEHAPASYAIIDAEAAVVRSVYEQYTVNGLSIGAITNLLNEQGVPTRKRVTRWERSTVWAMLRNPAYKGMACFNKTKLAKRQRVTRPIRLRGGIAKRDSAGHERPREEWIEIPVPPIIAERPSHLPRSVFRLTKIMPLVARRRLALCRAWYHASNAATVSIAPRRDRPHAGFIITVAWAPTDGVILLGRSVIANRSGKILLMRWYGARLPIYWKIRTSFKRNWTDGWLQLATLVPPSAAKTLCNASWSALREASNVY